METPNDWKWASAWFIGSSSFSAFFDPCDSYEENSYWKNSGSCIIVKAITFQVLSLI